MHPCLANSIEASQQTIDKIERSVSGIAESLWEVAGPWAVILHSEALHCRFQSCFVRMLVQAYWCWHVGADMEPAERKLTLYLVLFNKTSRQAADSLDRIGVSFSILARH